MEAFYEESALAVKSNKERKKYAILNVVFWIFVVLAVVFGVQCIFNIPWGATNETAQAFLTYAVFCGFVCVCFASMSVVAYKWKNTLNVTYDYLFVSGELRIARVYNSNKRKMLAKIDCADILQVGDCDNPFFSRLSADPNTKTTVCTSNDTPSEGKFFMYVLVGNDGKSLYVLECREALLMHVLRSARRGVLEDGYVMQEKKNK